MEALYFRVIMYDMQALIKKEISPSRMRKYYSGEILLCGVLRRYVAQNIVAIAFGNLRLNGFTSFYVFNWQIFAVVKMWSRAALYKYLSYQVSTLT